MFSIRSGMVRYPTLLVICTAGDMGASEPYSEYYLLTGSRRTGQTQLRIVMR